MSPADFTIEFYRKCLSQARWNSSDERDIESVSLLIKVANERGGEFIEAYHQRCPPSLAHLCGEPNEIDILRKQFVSDICDKMWPDKPFPVASQEATETQDTKPNTTMNTLLKDIYETLVKPIVDAIDRNTAKLGSAPSTCSSNLDGVPPPSVKEEEDKPAEPKKRGPKAKAAEPAPEPTPVVEPEVVQEEELYLTGPELVALMRPLMKTVYSDKLVEFRNNTLGFPKMTREMTDPAMLRQMEAKIREFLAANEEDQKDAA